MPSTPHDKPEYAVPARYASAGTSGLTASVPANTKGSLEIDFTLKD
ncbi:MAG: hypothetical protein JXM70_25390 [Pirellulales bacterium]|nr:hypothetical protein [Pirellulales bacterium]